ncbi:MAG: hypothetical protein Q9218_002360 [Villophora microphyllina]
MKPGHHRYVYQENQDNNNYTPQITHTDPIRSAVIMETPPPSTPTTSPLQYKAIRRNHAARTPTKKLLDSMPRKAAPKAAATPPSKVYIIKKTEGWRPADNPLGKVDHTVIGVYLGRESANTFARQYLDQHWREQYGNALEDTLENGAISLELETGKEDGMVFIDVEEHAVDGRMPWEM